MTIFYCDFETNGFAKTASPLTVAMMADSNSGECLGSVELKFRLKDNESWDERAEEVHGITHHDAQSFPKGILGAFTLIRFIYEHGDDCKDNTFIQHANGNFDWNFLEYLMLDYNLHDHLIKKIVKQNTRNTIALLKEEKVPLENHKLNTVMEYLGVEFENHHEAMADTKACRAIYRWLRGWDKLGETDKSNKIDKFNDLQLDPMAGWFDAETNDNQTRLL